MTDFTFWAIVGFVLKATQLSQFPFQRKCCVFKFIHGIWQTKRGKCWLFHVAHYAKLWNIQNTRDRCNEHSDLKKFPGRSIRIRFTLPMSLASRRAYSWLNATSIAAGLGCALALDLKRSEGAWWRKVRHLIRGQAAGRGGQEALWRCLQQERSQWEKLWQGWGPDWAWKQRSRHP